MITAFEVTIFENTDLKSLTKTIRLEGDKPLSIAAALMWQGRSVRFRFDDPRMLADRIASMRNYEALAIGALKAGIPDSVTVKTAEHKANGAADDQSVIARTLDYLVFNDGPALALLDYDTKASRPASRSQTILRRSSR
jgi:hypothetical protein